MPDPPEWITWLRNETAAWVKDGLIEESQRGKIVERYPVPAAPPPIPKSKTSAKNRLPAILVGLAVLLIGVGLILFYAANWKRMTPSVKLIQVFALIVVINSGAFFFLFKKSAWTAAGRGLLMLGLLVFGAAIGLVAQVFHISAHPTNGILTWALVVMATAAVMRERWALYLAFLLMFIWDIWERSIFDNPNYPMLPAIAVLYALSVWNRSNVGRFISVFLAIVWFYEVNLFYLVIDDFEDSWIIFALTQIPFGALLIGLALAFRKQAGEALATTVRMVGWIVVYIPLLTLSWPIEVDGPFLWNLEGSTPFLIQFGVVTLLGVAVMLMVKAQGSQLWRVLGIALVVGLALISVRSDSPAMVMSIMVLALISFHAATLYAGAKIGLPGASIMALILAFVTIAARAVGHPFLSGGQGEEIVSATLSGFFFLAVMFFMNELIRVRNRVDPDATVHQALAGACLAVGYIIVFGASFGEADQDGLVPAETGVPILIIVAIAVGLWLYLWFGRFSNRRALAASGVALAVVLICMVTPSEYLASPIRQILLNILLFFIAGSVIAYAVSKNSTGLVNIAIAAIVIHVMTRYFDVFWSMLSGSLLFIVTGLVLFAVAGFMEWQRRRLLARMRDDDAEPDTKVVKGGEA